MKKYSLIVLLVAVLSSCMNSTENTAVLSGKVANYKDRIARLISEDNKLLGSSELTADGQFSIEIDLDTAQVLQFRNSKEFTSIYLQPGDHLTMTLDADEFDESMEFSGDASFCNTYLVRKYLVMEHLRSESVLAFEPDDYLLEMKLNTEELWQILDRVSADKMAFVEVQKKQLNIELADLKLNYPYSFEMISGDELTIEDSFYNFLNDIDLEDQVLMESAAGQEFLQSYVHYKATLKATTDDFKEISLQKMNVLQEEFKEGKLRSELAFIALKRHFSDYGTHGAEQLKDLYDTLVNDPDLNSEMNAYYAKMQELEPGKPAKNFRYPDIQGKEYSLSDFKGKYVYIDVWATWCAPCKIETPHLKDLERSYRGKDIVFMSVSVDEKKDVDVWRETVNTQELKGIQLYAGGWSEITDVYEVNGIPRFILIDPEGNIFNANAPRPSSSKIDELLSSLNL